MPYYYGGYGDFLANNIYFLLLIPVMLLSLWAQAQVSGNFSKYSRVSNRRRLTGAQAAEAVLRALCERKGADFARLGAFDAAAYKEQQYDLLADAVRSGLDMEFVYRVLNREV